MVTTSMRGVSISSAVLRAYAWDDPQCANGAKHEARSEYEREIEHASFHNRHNILLSLGAPPIVAAFAKGYEAYHWA